MMRKIVRRRMEGDKGEKIGKMINFIEGFDEEIERNKNRIEERRLSIGKGEIK